MPKPSSPSSQKLWMVSLNKYTDDYKRPGSSIEQIGTFTTRRAAIITGVTAAIEFNAEYWGDDFFFKNDEEEQLQMSEKAQKRIRDRNEGRKKYIQLARSVCDLDLHDDDVANQFTRDHQDALEEALGPGEFGPTASGARPDWQLAEVDSDIQAEATFKKFWDKIDKPKEEEEEEESS